MNPSLYIALHLSYFIHHLYFSLNKKTTHKSLFVLMLSQPTKHNSSVQ